MAHKSIAIQRRFNDSGNSKKVAGINRNRWPLSTGISGRFEPESMATLDRNMQPLPESTSFGHGLDKIAKNSSVLITQAKNGNQGICLIIKGKQGYKRARPAGLEPATF